MGILTVAGDQFLMDGKPYTILSGAIHYFRVVPEYWESSLKKLRACGFNTVETYACWNLHERQKGVFDFSGGLDIARFFSLAQKAGLNVIFRPGPYICAEWDWGALPPWLMQEKGLEIRCDNAPYLHCVRAYFERLFEQVRPFYAQNGGAIILTQVENEYGSYADDHGYMIKMRDLLREMGATGLLITADGSSDAMLTGGTLPDCTATVNFGPSDITRQLLAVRRHGRAHPLMSGEFWGGQFDHWGKPRNLVSVSDCVDGMNEMLDLGASFNYYMFQGGTNFGFMNGANYFDKYYTDVSSYDYNAPLSEAGDRTEKYFALKAALEARFGPAPACDAPDTDKRAYGRVTLSAAAGLLEQRDALSSAHHAAMPQDMESLKQDTGFILYSAALEGPMQEGSLDVGDVRDRAQIFINGEFRGVAERDGRRDDIRIELAAGETARIDILVENRGRVNFGSRMRGERKGLLGCVRMDFHGSERIIMGWESRPMPMNDLRALRFAPETVACPAFLRGTLPIDEPADTFLSLPSFTRGVAFVNGHCLGRYWHVGPQQTLYVPAPWLHTGENEVIVLELNGYAAPEAFFLDHPVLNELHTEDDA